MIKRLAPVLVAALSIFSTISATAAAAPGDPSVQLQPAADTFAAGSDAVFHVTLTGQADASSLDYSADGGTVTGALALNETGDGRLAGAVFVRRDSVGAATVFASRDGVEVARATATFVEGAPLTVDVSLIAEPGAAARTWFFDILDASGAERAFIQVGTSGDRPDFAVASQPLPFGEYTVRPALSKDVAAACGGPVFFAMSPALGVATLITSAGATASFTVRSCAVPEPQAIGAVGDRDTTRPAPLPPATGNGYDEANQLQEWQIWQLARLAIGISGVMILGIILTRFLAHVAPVRPPGKHK